MSDTMFMWTFFLGTAYIFGASMYGAWLNIEEEMEIGGEFFVRVIAWPLTVIILSPVFLIKAVKALGIGVESGTGGVPKYIGYIKSLYKQEIKN
jgi:hypothetical protein